MKIRMSLQLQLRCSPWQFYCGIAEKIAGSRLLVKAESGSVMTEREGEGLA